MNKKKLPKVIVRTRDDMRGTTANGSKPDAATSDAIRPEATEPHVASAANVHEAYAAAAAPPEPVAPPGTTDAAPAPSPPPAVDAVPRAALPLNPVDAERRRAQALRIVNRHAGYSAVGGIIPLPVASFAGITAVTVRMVKSLSDHYGVPFERDRARAIVVGLVAGAMPTGLGVVTSSALLYLVPVSAIAGLAVSTVAAAACTRGIGRIFVEHFESGAPLDQIRTPDSPKVR
jgi:uncharacterized protein (DUF697 family)